MNYFDSLWGKAIIGNSCEAFIHFNLRLLSKETEELYFSVLFYDFYPPYEPEIEDLEINLILVESNWNSSDITWNNKPRHEEIIDTVNTSEIRQYFATEYYDLEKTINLTDILEEQQLNEISFCINITENNAELNTNVIFRGIMLLYYYEKFLISYTTIISSFIIFSMLIGTVFYLRKDLYYCPECDMKRSLTEKFCSSSQINFKDEILIKSSDYQLLIIVLWLFAFLEAFFLLITVAIDILYLLLPGIMEVYYSFTALLILSIIAFPIKIWKKIKKYREINIK